MYVKKVRIFNYPLRLWSQGLSDNQGSTAF
jgi:hypothetical protein